MEYEKIFKKGENYKQDWNKAEPTFTDGNEHLMIFGKPVMERWETPLMYKLAEIVTSRGGRVLEVGFGLSISASRIQSFDIDEHVIIEGNNIVFDQLEKWSSTAPRPVQCLRGLWQDIAPTLPDGTFDGILYDAYALSEETFHTHYFDFIKGHGYRLLKPGGILTYCNVSSADELMKTGKYSDIGKLFQETQLPYLLEAGFVKENITIEAFPVSPPPECRYYSCHQAIAPTIVKPAI